MNPNDQLGLILALLSVREQMPSTTDPQPMPQDPYTDWSIEFPMDPASRDRRLIERGKYYNDAVASGTVDPRVHWLGSAERAKEFGWLSLIPSAAQEDPGSFLNFLMTSRVPGVMSTRPRSISWADIEGRR